MQCNDGIHFLTGFKNASFQFNALKPESFTHGFGLCYNAFRVQGTFLPRCCPACCLFVFAKTQFTPCSCIFVEKVSRKRDGIAHLSSKQVNDGFMGNLTNDIHAGHFHSTEDMNQFPLIPGSQTTVCGAVCSESFYE